MVLNSVGYSATQSGQGLTHLFMVFWAHREKVMVRQSKKSACYKWAVQSGRKRITVKKNLLAALAILELTKTAAKQLTPFHAPIQILTVQKKLII